MDSTGRAQRINWSKVRLSMDLTQKAGRYVVYVRVASVFQHPKNSDMFIIHGNGKISWVTNDCGNTFYTLNHGRQAYRFTFHPEFDSYVLSLFKADDCMGDSCSEYGSLSLSKDWGKSWKIIRRRVVDYAWYRHVM